MRLIDAVDGLQSMGSGTRVSVAPATQAIGAAAETASSLLHTHVRVSFWCKRDPRISSSPG
ncbi:MAG TPA: hypothetical protein V6D48_21970 [Oculatellaceae cyanobacterium]